MSEVRLVKDTWKRVERTLPNNLSAEAIECFRLLTDPDNIGWDSDKGQIRPGKLGKFDVYYTAWQQFGLTKMEARIISGLSVDDIWQAEYDDVNGFSF